MVIDEMVVKPLQQATQDSIVRDGQPPHPPPLGSIMALTILEGSTFCVCDELGDLDEPTAGLFASDTRFLSRWILTVNGARPLLLSSDKVDYFSAAFYLRNPIAGGLGQDELSIARERFVGDGMQDHVVVRNHSHRRLEFELALEVGTDFADIFAVKDWDFALGDPGARAAAARPRRRSRSTRPRPRHAGRRERQFGGVTQLFFSEPGEIDGSTIRYRLALDPGERGGCAST